MLNSTTAPYYLATSRGFYKGAANAVAADLHANDILFTSNIRRATAFSSFDAAEMMFSLLLSNSSCDMNTVSSYHAILCCPVVAIGASCFVSLPDVYAECKEVDTSITINPLMEQLLHEANCCCCEELQA